MKVFKSDNILTYRTEYYKQLLEYPVGTKLYFFNVVDPQNRYLKLPWNVETTFWIETNPLQISITTTSDKLSEYIKFFEEHDCNIGLIKQKIVTEPKTIKKIVNKNNNIIEIKKIIENDIVIFPTIYITDKGDKGDNNVENFLHDYDAFSDFEGIKRIIVTDNNNITFYDPNNYTIEKPFNLCNKTYSRIDFEIDDVSEIKFNSLLYNNEIRQRELTF